MEEVDAAGAAVEQSRSFYPKRCVAALGITLLAKPRPGVHDAVKVTDAVGLPEAKWTFTVE